MRTLTRFSIGMITATGLTTMGILSAGAFSDVSPNSPEAAAINSLQSQGIVEGYADGTYRPAQRINRAEFVKILLKSSGRYESPEGTIRCFADFTGNEQWYWGYACAAREQGLIQGYPDGRFRGEQSINTAEGLKIALNAFGIPLPQYFREPDNWYDPYFDAASSTQIFSFIPRQPSRLLTRGDMALIIAECEQPGLPQCDGHQLGENYPSPDGCNTCTCTENGSACTKKYCGQTQCYSSNDCAAGFRCSTERGDCQSPCPPGAMCIQACSGVCEPSPVSGGSCTDRRSAIDRSLESYANRYCSVDSDCEIFIRSCEPYVTCGAALRKDASSRINAQITDYYDDCRAEQPSACAMCAQQSVGCVNGLCQLR
jgi:hypothetical protein